ncbi:MAG: tyrosine-type recombinase/integrase [Blastocatellia bacterium]
MNRVENIKIKGEWLFPGRGDSDSPLVKINAAHTAAVLRAKVAPFELYALRHTFATRAARAGVDLVTLASLLGHSRLVCDTLTRARNTSLKLWERSPNTTRGRPHKRQGECKGSLQFSLQSPLAVRGGLLAEAVNH